MAPLHPVPEGGHFDDDADPGTGLRTAAAFRRHLTEAVRGARLTARPCTLAVVLAGIGADAGASRRARRLAAALRRAEGFAYRLDRDHFAIIVPSAQPEDVAAMLARMARELGHGAGGTDPELSAGVAMTGGGRTAEDLMAAAVGMLRRGTAAAA